MRNLGELIWNYPIYCDLFDVVIFHVYAATIYSVPSNGVDCNRYIILKSCDPGYMLQGSGSGEVCQNSGSGSAEVPSRAPLNHSNSLPDSATILSPVSCSNLTYQCNTSCNESFTGADVTYLCNAISDPTMVDWVPIGEIDVMCERGLL